MTGPRIGRAEPRPAHHTPASWSNEDCEQEGNILGHRPGYLVNFCQSVHDRFWFRSEFLAWWTKGFATPPLLTTSPTGTAPAQAGVLGRARTSVLFGGKNLGGGFLPGERLTFGAWLNCCQTWGVEASYLQSTVRRRPTTPTASRADPRPALSSM